MKHALRTILAALAMAALGATARTAEPVDATPAPEAAPEPVRHDVVSTPEVRHDVSPPLDPADERLLSPQPLATPGAAGLGSRLSFGMSADLASAPGLSIPAPSANFPGIGNGFFLFTVHTPTPDVNGDIGLQSYVQMVNNSYVPFTRTGTAGPLRANNAVWGGFGGTCETENDGAGVVVYDSLADRWVISRYAIQSVPPLQCIAVSTTGNPSGTYYRYAFAYNDVPDLGKIGVWSDAYYATFNIAGSFTGAKACAYDRAAMLAGQAATQQCVDIPGISNLFPADVDGFVAPPPGSPETLAATGSPGSLNLYAYHVDWSNSANSTLTPRTISPGASPITCGLCVPQAGSYPDLDSLSSRLMYRLAYRNFGDHESLLGNFTTTSPGYTNTGAIHWFEIRNPGNAPFVYQQGTYTGNDASFRWNGSAAMDQLGDVGLSFNLASNASPTSIRYTGRLSNDPRGTMPQGERTVVTSGGGQTTSSWGRFSAMSVDPSDDCMFWLTNEYIPSNGTSNWVTRIASFQFPSCPGPVAAVASSPVCAGGSIQLVARGPNTGTWRWDGPNGYSSTARDPVIANATAANAGQYTLTHSVNGVPVEVATAGVVVVAEGGTCDDGNMCTQTDTCQGGTCVGASPVTCPTTTCHANGRFDKCDPGTGLCPLAADDTTCSDGNVCTGGDSCRSGACVSQYAMVWYWTSLYTFGYAVAVDDFNLDGYPDVASVSGPQGLLSVNYGLGDGSLADSAQLSVGTNPSAIATGWFGWDGVPEMAVADADAGTVVIYAAPGGTIQQVSSPAYGADGASAMIAKDFDGDSHPDIVVVSRTANQITVLQPVGPNEFFPSRGFTTGSQPVAIAAGDLNGDGWLDLVVANSGSNDVTVLLGDGHLSFEEQVGSPFRAGAAPSGVAIGDFDGDGHNDIAVINHDDNNVMILLNRQASGYVPARGSPIALGASPLSIVASYFDIDARPDLAIGKADGTLALLTGVGGGQFAIQATAPLIGPTPVMLAVGDLNLDGNQDLVVAGQVNSYVRTVLEYPNFNDGTVCNDGNPCTMLESCLAGYCEGQPMDSDGDGHVQAGCFGGDDCNDNDANVWQPPVGVTNMTLSGKATTSLQWDSQAAGSGPGTVYDLVSGSLTKPVSFAAASCLQPNGGTTYSDTRPAPDPGQAYWYLSRARNSCATATWGTSQEDGSMATCP